jgi:hypothetical protein
MASSTPLPAALLDPQKALEEERHIMAAYGDTAKTYSQLSVGALLLSVMFFEKVVKVNAALPVDAFLIAAWVGWLVTVFAGSFYQYLAVRFLEHRGENWEIMLRTRRPLFFRNLVENPWIVYGTMLIAFVLGSASFAVVGMTQLQ